MQEISNKKRSSRYFELAFQYHIAAASIWVSVTEVPYLFNPCMYLARHTIELLIKGLLYRDCENPSAIRIEIGSGRKRIDNTHNLLMLWTCYLEKRQPYMFPSEEESEKIRNILRTITNIDIDSTKYRYPETKTPGSSLNLFPIRINKDCHASPDISKSIPIVTITHNSVDIIAFGQKALKHGSDVFELIDVLFRLADYSNYTG